MNPFERLKIDKAARKFIAEGPSGDELQDAARLERIAREAGCDVDALLVAVYNLAPGPEVDTSNLLGRAMREILLRGGVELTPSQEFETEAET